jgi:hypothetical protein
MARGRQDALSGSDLGFRRCLIGARLLDAVSARTAPPLGPTARHHPERGDNKTMPARRKKERIVGSHFLWLLGQRQVPAAW